MINIHESIRDEDGETVKGRVKLFITKTGENGEILEFLDGPAVVPEGSGTLFIVDDYIINQIHKIKMVDGTLQTKEGEKIQEPIPTPEEIEREKLLAQLAELEKEIDRKRI